MMGQNCLMVYEKQTKNLFKFDDNKYLISLINYTYPKGVLAESKKDIIRVTEDEVLSFMEVDEYDNIDISFKFGSRFKTYLNSALKNAEKSLSINILEEKVYQSDVKYF